MALALLKITQMLDFDPFWDWLLVEDNTFFKQAITFNLFQGSKIFRKG